MLGIGKLAGVAGVVWLAWPELRRAFGGGVSGAEWGTGWVWPVPTAVHPVTDERFTATVSSGFESQRRIKSGPNAGQLRPHVGHDMMYRRGGEGRVPEYPPKIFDPRDGFASSKGYFLPIETPVLAARPGTVWSVKHRTDGGGWSVVLDHGKPWATYYTHLARVDVVKGDVLAAGQRFGVIGGSMADGSRIRHLHFEAWFNGGSSKASQDGWREGKGVMTTWDRRDWRPERW